MPNTAGDYAAAKLFSRGKSAEAPIVFFGEPTFLKADVWLQNESGQDLSLRRARLVAPSLERFGQSAEGIRLTIPRRLSANSREPLSLSLDLLPTVPPGTYEAELRLEGETEVKTFAAQITVAQNYALTLEPDEFVFPANVNQKISAEILVLNEGNVPIEVTPMGECDLIDPLRPECCPVCHRESEKDEADADELGSVTITNESVTIQPGDQALVKFTVQTPDSLPSNAHLRARPRIGNERFNLDLLTPVIPLAEPRRHPSSSAGPKHKKSGSKME